MRIGRYFIENVSDLYSPEYSKLPSLYIRHKYWYYWQFYFDWFGHAFYIDITRTDWNKCYKDKCANYTNKCKHNMECNECMKCFRNKYYE